MAEHSILPPSSASIWGAPGGCRGWVTFNQALPDTGGPEALEGTAVHAIALEMILYGMDAVSALDIEPETGLEVTPEMIESAKVYAGDVRREISTLLDRGYNSEDHFRHGGEIKLPVPSIHAENWGTLDYYLYSPLDNRLILWDFKNGHGIVEAEENWQAVNYFAALLDWFQIDGHQDQRLNLEFRVIQPRAYHMLGPIRSWNLKASDLRPYINQLSAGAHEAMSPGAKLRAGSHCRYCKGRAKCPALNSLVGYAFEHLAEPYLDNMSPEDRGKQLTQLYAFQDAIKHRLTGLEAEALADAAKGIGTPGYIAVDTFSRDTWSVDAATLDAMGKGLGLELCEPKPLTPSQAIKAGAPKELLAPFYSKHRTGVKLKPDTTQTFAAAVFSGDNLGG